MSQPPRPDRAQRLARRRFTRLVAAAGATGLGALLHKAMAMAPRPEFQGVHRMQGDVRVNGKPAGVGTVVRPGDTVTTGADSSVVFVIGEDAFLLRENGRIVVAGREGLLTGLRIHAGRLLSVFASGKGQRRYQTATVVIGIRGTGLYLEAEAERTYVCTCYGTVEMVSTDDPGVRETVTTTHHEAPRYVYRKGTREQLIEKARVINHTDDELTMLEWLVGRIPPFDPNVTRY